MEALSKILSVAKDLFVSRTVWGMILLVVNTLFAGKLDASAIGQIPTALGQVIDALQLALTSIGAAMVVIGRAWAKPTALVTPK